MPLTPTIRITFGLLGEGAELRIGNWKNLLNVAPSHLNESCGGNFDLACLQFLNDSKCHRHADIRSDQGLLELVPIDGFASKSVQ